MASPGGPGGGILLVEDEAELVRALRINLRARQYEVLTAGTGREALALAAEHPPDAIILAWVRRAFQLPPLPHGPAAPQAGGLPRSAPPPADRARHGLPLPALTSPDAEPGMSSRSYYRPGAPSPASGSG